MMTQESNLQQMSRKELRKYVLSHREDDEALYIYMKRLQTEPGVMRITGGLNQEDFNQLEQFLTKISNNTKSESRSETES